MKRFFLAVTLAFLSLPALSQPTVQMYGVDNNTPVSSSNPFPVTGTGSGTQNVNIKQGGANLSATNGIFTNILQGNAVLSATNPLFTNISVGSAAISATNGLFSNLLQGNAVLSTSNGVFTTPTGVSSAADITNATANIAASDTTISLTAPSRRLTVKTDPSAAVIYVDLTGGAATTADFRIDPGASMTWDLPFTVSSYHYIGASATGTISTTAW